AKRSMRNLFGISKPFPTDATVHLPIWPRQTSKTSRTNRNYCPKNRGKRSKSSCRFTLLDLNQRRENAWQITAMLVKHKAEAVLTEFGEAGQSPFRRSAAEFGALQLRLNAALPSPRFSGDLLPGTDLLQCPRIMTPQLDDPLES